MSARRDPAQRLAGYLARTLNYDEERQKVMAYGLGALFQMLLLLACSLAFGIIARCAWEAMILLGSGFSAPLHRRRALRHLSGLRMRQSDLYLRPCGALQIRRSRGASAVGGNRAGHSAGLCVPDFDRMEKGSARVGQQADSKSGKNRAAAEAVLLHHRAVPHRFIRLSGVVGAPSPHDRPVCGDRRGGMVVWTDDDGCGGGNSSSDQRCALRPLIINLSLYMQRRRK